MPATEPKLSAQRTFTTPLPGEDWPALAARVLPDAEPDAALTQLRSWNLHLAMRKPPGEFLGADVIFTEAPREPAPVLFGGIRSDDD